MMHEQDKAILKSLVSVAWADAKVTSEESQLLDGLLEAFEASPEEAEEFRAYARSPRTLDDIPLTDMSAEDRRALLQHAVLLTFVDGHQSAEEVQLLATLCERLRIPRDEGSALLSAAEVRAKRLLNLL